jgi:hypothetical protein
MCSTRVEERGSRIKSSRRMEGRTKELRGPSAIKSINPSSCILYYSRHAYSDISNNRLNRILSESAKRVENTKTTKLFSTTSQ